MSDVLPLAGLAHAVALDSLGQDHRRLVGVVDRGVVGGVHLLRVVAAAVQRPDVVIRHVGDQVEQLRILAEEVLTDVRAILRLEVLVLAVDALFHALEQQTDLSAAISRSHPVPQMTLMTFHPAPRKMPSSSWMILPLPRTGPSSRCRLQLMTKIRLSSFSLPPREIAPSDSGSSISPSPRNAQTCLFAVSAKPRACKYLRNRAW